MVTPTRPFPHRLNPNKTFDSICSRCFHVVGTTPLEQDLVGFEQAHECAGFNLNRMLHPDEPDRQPRSTP
jgi:hypothetical protein